MSFKPAVKLPELIDLTPEICWNGIMFIGDPHVYSGSPNRRRDECFFKTVCGKLKQAAFIAKKNKLFPIILGDLMHKGKDNDIEMLIELAKTFKEFLSPPLTLDGNHDKDGDKLTNKNVLRYLDETNQIRLFGRNGFVGKITLTSGQSVAIGGTPYGGLLPKDLVKGYGLKSIKEVKKSLGVEHTVWISHDDLAFQGAYPDAQLLYEIRGVDMVVNGHMHGTAPPVKKGTTVWYNPGNIVRLSIDMDKHEPAVWEWSPDTGTEISSDGLLIPKLLKHALEVRKASDVFDYTGTVTRALSPSTTFIDKSKSFGFVSALKEDVHSKRTDEAIALKEAAELLLKNNPGTKDAQIRFWQLFESTCEKLRKNN